MKVILKQSDYNTILKQANAEFPSECCGLLGGIKKEKDIEIVSVYPMRNTDASSEHFTMDPKEQFAVIKQIRRDELELIGNYHSHPYTPSRPSEEDKRLAYDPTMIYGILSLEHKDQPLLNFFNINPSKQVEKLDLIVE